MLLDTLCSYVACDDGSIKAADVRQQLLSGAWAEVGRCWQLFTEFLARLPGKLLGQCSRCRDACVLPCYFSGGTFCPCCGAVYATHPPAPAPPRSQSGAKADGAAAPLRIRTLTSSPPLELTAAHFALNRSGTCAAVAGSALEDPEISRVVVVDLTNCRPAPPAPTSPAHGSTPGGRGGAAPTNAHAVHDVCEAVVLDAELFASRPGLRVLQIGWHPDSDSHLAVLTSGAPSWEWYCVVCCTVV